MDSKSEARLAKAEREESPRTVLVEHRPRVHGVRDGCRCRAECTCGAQVLLPKQVATFYYNHSEPGPTVHRA